MNHQERMKVIHALNYLAACVKTVDQIQDLPDCNTCGRENCEYRPRWGEAVRLNCPLWEEE